MSTRTNDEYDEIFTKFCIDGDSTTPIPLSAWIEQYPDLSAELVGWAANMPSMTIADGFGASRDFEARSMAVGLEALHRAGLCQPAQRELSSLNEAARTVGAGPRDIAASVGIGMSLFAKLSRRLIDAASIPPRLVNELAAALQISSTELAAYLRRPPTLAPGAAYRSVQAPEITGTQPFAEAIAESPDMTDQQKRDWSQEERS